MSTVLFFRGFNTYATEDMRFGPFNFGPAHQYLEPGLRKRGFNFYALPEVGRGTIAEQLENSHPALLDLCRKHSLKGPVHLLGHSAGGIVARGFAHKVKTRPVPGLEIKSVVTVTTPHRGSRLAQFIFESQKPSTFWHKAISACGYDIEKRKPHFALWLPERIEEFNILYPDLPDIAYGSVVSGMPLRQLPYPLQVLYKGTPRFCDLLTDGIVELESQAWGKIIVQSDLDHGAALGMRTVLSPSLYRRNQKTFEQMVEKIASYMKLAESLNIKSME